MLIGMERNLPKLKEVHVLRNSERIDVIMFENSEIIFGVGGGTGPKMLRSGRRGEMGRRVATRR